MLVLNELQVLRTWSRRWRMLGRAK